MSEPLVSVIIIFFNEQRFIKEAIESVFTQTYHSWELLLVDDGSSDQSTIIAQSYAQQYPERVRYLEHEHHQNKGMSATRNLGISHAQGEYIAFLDADDLWLPQKLEQQLAIMDSHPQAALVCGRTQWWYSWTNQPEDKEKDFIQTLNISLNSLVPPPQVLLMFLQDDWASLHDILARRDLVISVGGYEDSFRGMYEDQAFHAKLCLKSMVFVSSECWCRYRQHSDACTSQSHKIGQYHLVRHNFLKWLEAYLVQQEAQNNEVWAIVQQQLWQYRHPLLQRVKNLLLSIGRKVLPEHLRHWLWTQWYYKPSPPVGWVRWGDLRRLKPISSVWPNHRGAPIDRYYIEKFLSDHAEDIQGHVLELGDASYTKRFGRDRVTKSDVLHARKGNPAATIVADFTCADNIASDTFDCIILTQTLLLIYDLRAAIQTFHRILKPGGILLVTVPGITQIIPDDMQEYGQYWSFTEQSAHKIFAEVFTDCNVTTETFGNVLTTTGFLYGLATGELSQQELNYHDHDYQLIIGVKVVKSTVS